MHNNIHQPVGLNQFDNRSHGRERQLYLRTLDLSTARTDTEFRLAGNFIFCDKETDGDAHIRFSSNQNPLFPVGANSLVQGLPFNKIYITNTAQAGKTLNIWYGQDVGIQPPNQDITSIGTVSTVNTVGSITDVANISAITPETINGSSFFYYGALTTLQTIVTPASNTAGIKIYNAYAHAYSGGYIARLMAKTSAPSAVTDNTAKTLAVSVTSSSSGGGSSSLNPTLTPLIVPAGYGLYSQSDDTTRHAIACEYEVL